MLYTVRAKITVWGRNKSKPNMNFHMMYFVAHVVCVYISLRIHSLDLQSDNDTSNELNFCGRNAKEVR